MLNEQGIPVIQFNGWEEGCYACGQRRASRHNL